MHTGDTIFGDNDEYFEHLNIEDALEVAWDYADPACTTLTVWEGEVGEMLIDDWEYDYTVEKVKERTFRVLRNSEHFNIDDLEEVNK